ncbi:unnamed protein product, partial [Ectocarpus sp. 12 AP-2014]
ALHHHVFRAFGAGFCCRCCCCCSRCYCLPLPPPAAITILFERVADLILPKGFTSSMFPKCPTCHLYCCRCRFILSYNLSCMSEQPPLSARTSLVFSVNADNKRQTALLTSAPSNCRHSYHHMPVLWSVKS